MAFNKLNNLGGWLVFLVALIVYTLTMEPTASFWDCGEFISSAYKLQIPHPPGAPLFLLLGRLFIILSGNDPAIAARAVNFLSAAASAFSILFLFWTITYFAKRIVAEKNAAPNAQQTFLVMSAGVIGALAFTFSDSFWFSAVEGEVYALSSFFTALVFWSILKWEKRAGLPEGNRWLVFIFFMMGLSIGVHLLNLLSIPAMVMVYYFRMYKPTSRGAILAFLAGCFITGFIQKFLIQYTVKAAGWMDVFFVNELSMPFFSGFAAFFILLAGGLLAVLRFANRKNYRALQVGVWGILFVLTGYSTYVTTMLRSNADPAVDLFNVDNPLTLVSYLGREDYSDWPIMFGPDYTDRAPFVKTGDLLVKGPERYEIAGQKLKQDWANTPSSHFFPRMYDNSNDRQQHLCYARFGGIEQGEQPTMADNLRYFTNYQAGWMYMRYLLWNFSGRQNDLQGLGNARDSNWISGIPFIDNVRYGDQSMLPDSVRQDNKAYNRLYMLPLLLGIAGMILQFKKHRKDFSINLLFFFFTGLAIVIYLNQSGFQPRERDYAYVGSFYAFAIWIGLGVVLISRMLQRFLRERQAIALAAVLCFSGVPLLMASEEWDDHDRSHRTFAVDMAKSYLESCPPNAILFASEDNDTYPLWYAQEVEGVRRDVRVMVNTLAASDWFFEQLRHKVNESGPFNIVFTKKQTQGNNRQVIYFTDLPGFDRSKFYDLSYSLKQVIGSDDPRFTTTDDQGFNYQLSPIQKFTMPVNRDAAIASGAANTTDNIANSIDIDLTGKNYLLRSDLLILALLSANSWDRPICFTSTTVAESAGLGNYIRQEGLTFRLTPVKYEEQDVHIERGIAYNNLMNRHAFGKSRANVYYDEENRRKLNLLRLTYAQVAIDLAANGEKEKAQTLLRRFDEAFDERAFPYGMTSGRGNQHNLISSQFLRAARLAGDPELAGKIERSLRRDLQQQLQYYYSLGDQDIPMEQLPGLAYQQLKDGYTQLSARQSAFANDILLCYQLSRQLAEPEEAP